MYHSAFNYLISQKHDLHLNAELIVSKVICCIPLQDYTQTGAAKVQANSGSCETCEGVHNHEKHNLHSDRSSSRLDGSLRTYYSSNRDELPKLVAGLFVEIKHARLFKCQH